MPGIVGIIGRDSPRDNAAALKQMVKCMMHESFYSMGTYVNERLGLWVGWVNHAGSFADCMPVWNEAKDVCLIFSGENYADRSDLDHLQSQGHQFDSNTASYLVHLYEEAGAQFINKLNGQFSGLLIDLREQKIILFNDRFGINRIYYHDGIDKFYFASEAKSLLKVLPQVRKYDMVSLGEFFACGSPMQNRTLFMDVSLLPAGSKWTYLPQTSVNKQSYFDRGVWESQAVLSPSAYYSKLFKTFNRILPKYFRASKGIGLSLTGGLDSRMVIAAAARQPFTLPTYTFGGLYRECADVRMARKVAKICKQNHEVLSLNRNYFREYPSLAMRTVYLTDGAMDVSGSVGLFVNRMAREIAPIRLTGNYGGEILRGLVVFRCGKFNNAMFRDSFVDLIKKAAETYFDERRCHQQSFIAFKQVPWHHYNRYCMEQSQLTVRSPFLDNELVALSYQAPAGLPANKEMAFRLINECNPLLKGISTDRGLISRASIVPFKIKQWIEEFMPRAEYVYDYGMPQWLAKIDFITSPLRVERLFLGRQKYYHFRTWYRDELSEFVKNVLLNQRSLSRPYLNGKIVEKIVTAHLKGYGNYTSEIHQLLTCELIQRQLIEQ